MSMNCFTEIIYSIHVKVPGTWLDARFSAETPEETKDIVKRCKRSYGKKMVLQVFRKTTTLERVSLNKL